MTGLAFPKPGRRDRKIRDAYARRHPRCEVQGCGQPADAVHLIDYAHGGGDTDENLLSLCWHHEGGAAGLRKLGAQEWLSRCAASLEPETLRRVARVLGLEE